MAQYEEDFEFGDKLPGRGEIAEERWVRAREQLVFRDLVQEMLSKSGRYKTNGSAISCPFHGSDRTPSFTFYDQNNSAFCFGCPPPTANQTYDPVSFIAKYFEISKVKALEWLEKHYRLPHIANQWVQEDEEDEDGPDTFYTVEDLEPMYLAVAPKLIESVTDARKVLKAYFIAQREDDPLFLARILGRERIASINQKRA